MSNWISNWPLSRVSRERSAPLLEMRRAVLRGWWEGSTGINKHGRRPRRRRQQWKRFVIHLVPHVWTTRDAHCYTEKSTNWSTAERWGALCRKLQQPSRGRYQQETGARIIVAAKRIKVTLNWVRRLHTQGRHRGSFQQMTHLTRHHNRRNSDDPLRNVSVMEVVLMEFMDLSRVDHLQHPPFHLYTTSVIKLHYH